jgi:hypothetical protein
MTLPMTFDQTPKGDFVKRKEIGESGHYDNVQYTLRIGFSQDGAVVHFSYYGDDDSWLDEEEIEEVMELHKKKQLLPP